MIFNCCVPVHILVSWNLNCMQTRHLNSAHVVEKRPTLLWYLKPCVNILFDIFLNRKTSHFINFYTRKSYSMFSIRFMLLLTKTCTCARSSEIGLFSAVIFVLYLIKKSNIYWLHRPHLADCIQERFRLQCISTGFKLEFCLLC